MKISELAPNVSSFLLGGRRLLDEAEIIPFIEKSTKYEGELDRREHVKAMLIFDTSKQRTWLVSTSKRLYCILDDVRMPRPKVRWSEPLNKLVSGGSLTVPIVVRDKSENTGYLDIGQDHRNWLFSKKLFSNLGVEESVQRLLHQAAPVDSSPNLQAGE